MADYALIDGNKIAAAVKNGYSKFLKMDNRMSKSLARLNDEWRERRIAKHIGFGDTLFARAKLILAEQGEMPEALQEAKSAYKSALGNYSKALALSLEDKMPLSKYVSCAVELGCVCAQLGENREARGILQDAAGKAGMRILDASNEFDKVTLDELRVAGRMIEFLNRTMRRKRI